MKNLEVPDTLCHWLNANTLPLLCFSKETCSYAHKDNYNVYKSREKKTSQNFMMNSSNFNLEIGIIKALVLHVVPRQTEIMLSH